MVIRVLFIWSIALMLSVCAMAQSEESSVRRVTVSLESTPAEDPKATDPQEPFPATANSQAPAQLSVATIEPTTRRPSKRRHIEYSDDQIVVVGLGADSTELTRTVMIDPRLIRVEAFRGEKDRTTDRLYRTSVNFSVYITDPAVVTIRILRPVWNGAEWSFEIIAETPLR